MPRLNPLGNRRLAPPAGLAPARPAAPCSVHLLLCPAARPPVLPGGADALYTFFDDADRITEKVTVAFLDRLKGHLRATQANTTANAELEDAIDQFKEVAADVLNYLRNQNSQALLLLLRQYAEHESLMLLDVDPDVLQLEVQRLLNLDQLGKWYARVASKDLAGLTTWPVVGLQNSQVGAAVCQCSTCQGAAWPGATPGGPWCQQQVGLVSHLDKQCQLCWRVAAVTGSFCLQRAP